MRFRAPCDFLADLLAGDPVALGLLGGLLLFAAAILLWGVGIMRDKRRLDEERKSRWHKSGSKPLQCET